MGSLLQEKTWRYADASGWEKPFMSVLPIDLSESDMDALERGVPELAQRATLVAYVRALGSRGEVLRVAAGDLVRVSSTGVKTIVAKAKPRRKVTVGEVIAVRRISGTQEVKGERHQVPSRSYP